MVCRSVAAAVQQPGSGHRWGPLPPFIWLFVSVPRGSGEAIHGGGGSFL